MTVTAAGPPWYSVAGGAPRIPGAVLTTSGPRSAQNGYDDDAQFQRVWSYTGRVLSATVDIDRADPRADKREAMRWGEADLTAHSAELIAALHDVLDDLRPR